MVSFYQDSLPAKRFHLLQYALLAYLVLEAVETRTGRGVLLAFAWIAGVALLDELLQGLLPGRFFAWRDVLGNLFGSGLGSATWALTSRRLTPRMEL